MLSEYYFQEHYFLYLQEAFIYYCPSTVYSATSIDTAP